MNTFHYIKKSFLLLLFIFFTSCTKDLYDDTPKESRNTTIKNISFKDLDKITLTEINKKIDVLKNIEQRLTQEQNKFMYDDVLNLYIDVDNGKLINNNGNLYFTFPMYRESEENLENIIFIPNNNGEMDSYIAKYNVTPEIYKDLTIEQQNQYNPEFQKILHNSVQLICVDVQELIPVPVHEGDLTGVNGNNFMWQKHHHLVFGMRSAAVMAQQVMAMVLEEAPLEVIL